MELTDVIAIYGDKLTDYEIEMLGIQSMEYEPLKKIVTFHDPAPYTQENTNDMKIKFKLFKWTEGDKISLEEYMDFLVDAGWGIMGTTAVDGKVIISCQWGGEK